MTNALPGHNAPAVGFEVPLEMLAACHGRVQLQCETLLRLIAHLQSHGSDRPAQEAARAVMRYFDTAAHHHHEDEEQDLFPALLETMAGSDAVCLRDLTASLCTDHRALERRWATLRQKLEAVAAGTASALTDADVSGFVQLYQLHIAREEDELLPMAARLLSATELDRIGLAMRKRRDSATAV
ncbi:Hemerythrin domain-containing protein [Rubrivivax sp. A210]|uniref:hemerythrin domain-containing protein n=1 Tax=Rubrivivax sp. A210 TaxID=2772301 RepID=UPI001919481F|nr:hemerythrin domain-containing protein [Rubrivivax sp. A210]CAD5366797.1 Hemerythrin domain-containing protein [Rubrivivax sp. A210]